MAGVSAGTAYVDVEPNLKNFTSKLRGDLDKHAKTVGRGAAIAGTAIVAGLAIGAKKAIDAASDMGETISKTQVVFGKAGAEMVKWGDTTARSLGIGKREALDAASIFGVFGKAAGLTGDRLTKFSKPLVTAAADLASFHNVPVAEGLDAIKSGLAGEVEPLRRFGILLNDAALREEALRQGLVKNTKEALTPQQKMLAAQALILKKLGPATGDFARTSDSAANKQKINAAVTADLTAKIGAGLLPAYSKLLSVGLTIVTYLGKHTGLVKVLAVGLGILATVLLAVAAAIKIAAIAQLLFNVALAPVALIAFGIIIGFVALGVALVLLWKKSETFRAIVTGAFDAVKAAAFAVIGFFTSQFPGVTAIVAQVAGAVAGFVSSMVGKIVSAWNAVRSTTTSVWNAISGFFKRWWPLLFAIFLPPIFAIVALWRKFGDNIKSAASSAWNAVKSVIGAILGAIIGVVRDRVNAVKAVAVGVFRTFAAPIGDALRKIVGVIKGPFNTAKDWIAGFGTTLFSIARNIGISIVNGILSGLGGLLSAVKSKITGALKGALDGAKGALGISSPSKLFREALGIPLGEGIVEGVLSALSGLGNAIASGVQGAVDKAKARLDPIIGGFQSVAQSAFQAVSTGQMPTVEEVQTMVREMMFGADLQALMTRLAGGMKKGPALQLINDFLKKYGLSGTPYAPVLTSMAEEISGGAADVQATQIQAGKIAAHNRLMDKWRERHKKWEDKATDSDSPGGKTITAGERKLEPPKPPKLTLDRGGWIPPHSTILARNATPYWEPVGPPMRAAGAGVTVENMNIRTAVDIDLVAAALYRKALATR